MLRTARAKQRVELCSLEVFVPVSVTVVYGLGYMSAAYFLSSVPSGTGEKSVTFVPLKLR